MLIIIMEDFLITKETVGKGVCLASDERQHAPSSSNG